MEVFSGKTPFLYGILFVTCTLPPGFLPFHSLFSLRLILNQFHWFTLIIPSSTLPFSLPGSKFWWRPKH